MTTKTNSTSPRGKLARRAVNHQAQRPSPRAELSNNGNGNGYRSIRRLVPSLIMKTEVPNKTRMVKSRRAPARQMVHFELVNAIARRVCLAGSFNGWKPEQGEMVRLGDGKWSRDLSLAPGTYEYRLVVDGQWMPDPRADHTVVNPLGERNSLLTVS
jgi:hypothetical protein